MPVLVFLPDQPIIVGSSACHKVVCPSMFTHSQLRHPARHARQARSGLTRAEGLVLVCAVGLFLGVVFPAICHVRSSARQTHAIYRAMELGGHVQTYTLDHDRFPVGKSHSNPVVEWPADLIPARPALNP